MATDLHLPLLDRVRIASPCHMKWEDMTGDDIERHCAQCNLSVFNLSNMTRDDAEALLQSKIDDPGKRLCAGFFRRADGTILMKDCPVGFRAARLRMAKTAGRIAAAVGFLMFGGYAAATSRDASWSAWGWSMKLGDMQPFKAVAGWLRPPAPPQVFYAGRVCLPQPAPTLPSGKVEFGPRPQF